MTQKGQERLVRLACKDCKRVTHWSKRRKKGENVKKLDGLKKYCRWCRAQTPHKEIKK